ncbi:tetratricopeptide repeat protein [Paludibacter sp.]
MSKKVSQSQAKKVAKTQDDFESVENALTKSEAFIEKNQKHLITGLGIVAIIVMAILAINNFYVKPRAAEAANEMYKSQLFFAKDSFNIALNGDGFESIGFEEISSKYSLTSSGNLAKAYAGICYYNLGDYENAVKFLLSYDADDSYFSTSVLGLAGDCYVELNQTEKAIQFFTKAVDSNNEVLSPVFLKKAGIAYESLGDSKKALSQYMLIKEKYSMSQEGQDIDKYISRLQ